MKYIIFEDFAAEETPVLFPSRILHEEMREQMPYARVLAAGEVYLQNRQFVCRGGSKELEAYARPEDSALISGFFQKQD
ncbi:MAG: hypothetical protein ACLFRL_02230 [Desulfohalobiaceae bacterium]